MLRSINLSTEYGDPFDEETSLKPVSSDYKTMGEMGKEYILNWKGAFLNIEKGLHASGEGGGSYQQNSLCVFVSSRRGKKVVANGHPTGYTFIRCKPEGVWDHVVATVPPDIATTMDATTRIEFKRKKTTDSSSSKKKKHRNESESGDELDLSSEEGDPKLNILHRLEQFFKVGNNK